MGTRNRIGIFTVLSLGVVLLLLGQIACDSPIDEIRVYRADEKNEVPTGWVIDSQGTFRAGFHSNVREILYITSPDGRKFLVITGCGVTELRRENNGNQTVTVEE